MPITLATLTTDERDGIDATRGALDANAVWVQYVCQTGPGEHDPDKEPDAHVRPSHRALHGTVWRLDDPSAPIPPVDFGCFLPGTMVEGVFDGASRAFYVGEAVEILLRSGRKLRVTPNHPVLTGQGLTPAGALSPGDQVAGYRVEIGTGGLRVKGDEEHKPAAIEEVFELLSEGGPRHAVWPRGEDFHGDALRFEGKVDVVGAYALLCGVVEVAGAQAEGDAEFPPGESALPLPGKAFGDPARDRGLAPAELHPGSGMGGGDLLSAAEGGHARPLHALRLRLAAELHTFGQETPLDRSPAHAEALGYRVDGLPLLVPRDQDGRVQWRQARCLSFGDAAGLHTCLAQPGEDALGLDAVPFAELAGGLPAEVGFDDVIEVSRFQYAGHVYDLRSPFGSVVANGALTSNCRCAIRYVAAPETAAEGLLPEAPSEPVSDPREPAREWLDANVPNWEKVAQAAADAPPQLAEAAAFNEARKLGIDRETARLALFAQPYPTPSPEPLGLGPLSGVGRAGRLLAERWLAGDLEAGAELARKYPATYARLLRERGPT